MEDVSEKERDASSLRLFPFGWSDTENTRRIRGHKAEASRQGYMQLLK